MYSLEAIRAKVGEIDASASVGTMAAVSPDDHAALDQVAQVLQRPGFRRALRLHNQVTRHEMETLQPVLVFY